jgi:hypothetical protein
MSVGQDSSVGIAACYRLVGPGMESQWERYFLLSSRPALGPTQPAIQWVLGLSQGVKQLGHGTDPPPNTEVKKRVELYLPLWAFMACYRANFTFTVMTVMQHSSNTSGLTNIHHYLVNYVDAGIMKTYCLVLLMSCRRGPSDFSRQNKRQLCTVSNRGNCNCSERLTSLPSLCHHTVREKTAHNNMKTKLALVPFLTRCHYGQHSSLYDMSCQYDYLI